MKLLIGLTVLLALTGCREYECVEEYEVKEIYTVDGHDTIIGLSNGNMVITRDDVTMGNMHCVKYQLIEED